MDITKFWYKESKSELYRDLYQGLKYLLDNQGWKEEADLRHMRLYGNMNIQGFNYNTYNQINGSPVNKIALNVVKACIDTATNKIAKNKPRIQFVTSNGDGTMQKKAKNLTKFVDGIFYSLKVYSLGQKAFKDAGIGGTGILKIFRKDDKVAIERVFPNELIIDDAQGLYGNPREIRQKKFVNRDVLIAQFPEHAQMIRDCKESGDFSFKASTNRANMIMVVEGWHLSSSKKKKDGRHAICIENGTLYEEKYEKNYFPFAFIRWNDRPIGFWGQGIAEELVGIQVEINKLLRVVQQSMDLLSVPRVLINKQSKVNGSHFNNDIGNIITYEGMKPEILTAAAVHPEVFNQINTLYGRAFEIVGISQLSAQSKKPAGLDSGKALREFNDIESERFATVGQAYEDFFIEIARQSIEVAKEIYEETGEYKVKVKGKHFVEEIDWKDVNLDEDSYVMQPLPTSPLSNTFSGRLADIQELINLGVIQKDDAASLLDYPDIQKFNNLKNASVEDIMMTIEKMVEDGEYFPPEPYQNLVYGVEKVQSAYLRAKWNYVPEERLELLRRWLSDADALITKAQEATQPPPAPTAPAPTPDMAVPALSPEEMAIADAEAQLMASEGQVPPEIV